MTSLNVLSTDKYIQVCSVRMLKVYRGVVVNNLSMILSPFYEASYQPPLARKIPFIIASALLLTCLCISQDISVDDVSIPAKYTP